MKPEKHDEIGALEAALEDHRNKEHGAPVTWVAFKAGRLFERTNPFTSKISPARSVVAVQALIDDLDNYNPNFHNRRDGFALVARAATTLRYYSNPTNYAKVVEEDPSFTDLMVIIGSLIKLAQDLHAPTYHRNTASRAVTLLEDLNKDRDIWKNKWEGLFPHLSLKFKNSQRPRGDHFFDKQAVMRLIESNYPPPTKDHIKCNCFRCTIEEEFRTQERTVQSKQALGKPYGREEEPKVLDAIRYAELHARPDTPMHTLVMEVNRLRERVKELGRENVK